MGPENEFVWRLLIATMFGGLLGLERSLSGKHAGMRTYALVSLGSALFTVVGIAASYEFAEFAGVNPLQLAGFVIVGIGFIGSGLAGFRGDHPVELTTAAGIWVVAGVGVAVGSGYGTLGLAATVLAILVFSVFARVEHKIRTRIGKSYNSGAE